MVKKSSKKTLKKSKKQVTGLRSWFVVPGQREASTMNDTKNAILIVSLTINVAIFVAWLILKLTTAYDQQVFDFLFTR